MNNTFAGYKIGKTIDLEDGTIIVLLDMLCAPLTVSQIDVEQNVYRIDKKGNVIWRIAGDVPFYPRSPFTGIGFDENNRFLGYRFDCGEYLIDIKTGVARLIQLAK